MTETSALSCAFIHNPYKIAKTGSHELGRKFRFSQQIESLAEYGMLSLPVTINIQQRALFSTGSVNVRRSALRLRTY